MKQLLVLILLLFSMASLAQNDGKISGSVISSADSSALQSATAAVYKQADSSLVNYQVTNKNGAFAIKELPLKTPLYFLISHTGYMGYAKSFYLDAGNHDLNFDINLVKDTGQLLEEVVVKTVAPVTMRGDTLEINPDGIRLDSNEVVEELLQRVPGIARWEDSSITVNGKKVRKVYVDGRPFFDGGIEMAIKNLPKHSVDKIQVYQEKDIYRQTPAEMVKDSTVVMNIKLKPDKRKGYFGTTAANAGTNKSYGGMMSLQLFNRKTNFGVNGNISNTSRALGDIGEEYGNKDLNVRNNWNINSSFRQNFNREAEMYTDKSLHGNYIVSGNRNSAITNRTTVKNLADSKLTGINTGYNLSRSVTQMLSTGYNSRKREKSFSTYGTFNRFYSSSSSEGNVVTYRNDSVLASRSANRSQGENISNSFAVNGNFDNNSVNETPGAGSFLANYSAAYNQAFNNSNTYSQFESLTDSIYTNLYDRKYVNRNSNFNGSVALSYNGLRPLIFRDHNFWNINIRLNSATQLNHAAINADVSDRDSATGVYHTNANLTNKSGVANLNNRTGIQFEKTFIKNITDRYQRTMQVSTNLQNQLLYQKNTSTLSYRNRNFLYNFFTPNSNITYNYNKIDEFYIFMTLAHNSSASAPTIDQLYPIQDSAANRYNMVVGNPNLKSTFSNDFSYEFSFNKNSGFGQERSYSAGMSMAYNNERNGIADSTIYDNNGGSTTYYINTPGNKSFNTGLNGNVSFMFDKTNLRISSNTTYGTGYIHYAAGGGYTNSLRAGVQVSLSRPFKKSRVQFSYRSNFGGSEGPQYVNREQLRYRNKNQDHNVSFSFNAPGIIDINLQQSVSGTNAVQAGGSNPFPAVITRSYNTTARIVLKVPKNFTVGTDLRYSNNISASANPIRNTNWNAHFGYFFPRKKMFEARIAVFNILGQNQNVNNYSSGNITTTSVVQGLQRYFQFSLSYFPKRFGGRGNSRPMGDEE